MPDLEVNQVHRDNLDNVENLVNLGRRDLQAPEVNVGRMVSKDLPVLKGLRDSVENQGFQDLKDPLDLRFVLMSLFGSLVK